MKPYLLFRTFIHVSPLPPTSDSLINSFTLLRYQGQSEMSHIPYVISFLSMVHSVVEKRLTQM